MARLTYAVVAGALAALVAGFFVKSTTLPLIASIGLSALATLLILVGWGRRLRLEDEGALEPEPEPEIEDVEFIDLGMEEEEAPPRRRRRPRREPVVAEEEGFELPELPEEAEITYEMPALEPGRPARPRRKPKARPAYVELEADLVEAKPRAARAAKAAPARPARPKPRRVGIV